MKEFVFYGVEAVLLAALPIAFFLMRFLVRREPDHIRSVAFAGGAFLAAVLGFVLAGVSTRGTVPDLVVLLTSYLVLCCLFILSFRLKPVWFRIVSATVLGAPLVVGYLISTVGVLALVFILGDLLPEHTQEMPSGLLCRVTSFGNATTSVNGYFAHLVRPLGIFEKEEFVGQFPDPVTPSEACSRAGAMHAS